MAAVPSMVLGGMKLLSAGAPSLAARFGESLMFRTRRRAKKDDERALLARAERSSVATAHGTLPVWQIGRGPSVLLVHGWNGHGSQLAPLVEPLVESGHRVVWFDAPGHGEAPGSQSSMVHFADAIEEIIDWVRPVFGPLAGIVTHSMGGPAAVLAMSRFRARGELAFERELADTGIPARRFVLIAPPIDVGDFIRGFSRMTALGEQAETLLRRRIERRFGPIEHLYAPALARGIAAPALVIHDVQDREVPVSRGRELARAWPGARLVETSGLGHVRILRDPAVVRTAVEFVTDARAA